MPRIPHKLACLPRSGDRNSRRRLSIEPLEQRLLLYQDSGQSWSDNNISFSYIPDGTVLSGGYENELFSHLDSTLPTETWQREIGRAFQTWANASSLNFRLVQDDGSPQGISGNPQGDSRFGDIRIAARFSSRTGSAVYPGGSALPWTISGDLTLSTRFNWATGKYPDLYSVTLHEIGHALGLDHSDVTGAVMGPATFNVFTGLSTDDIAGIQSIYGARQHDIYDQAGPNDSFVTATNLVIDPSGRVETADLTSMDDVDYYRITVPQGVGGTLSVAVDARAVSLLAPQVEIYDSSGHLIAREDADYGGTANLTLSGVRPGEEYFVVADGATGDEFGMGAYRLAIHFGGEPEPQSDPGISVTLVSPLVTTEGGGTAGFQIVLDTRPTANVAIGLTSTHPDEGRLSTDRIVFTPENWSIPQSVTVTGVDDTQADGDVEYEIAFDPAVSQDARYHGLDPADLTLTNRDDDPSPVRADALYVWDISFQERGSIGGDTADVRVVVTVRSDADGDGLVSAFDPPVQDAIVRVVLTGPVTRISTGSTNATGVFATSWIQSAPAGDYVAEVVAITHSTLEWNAALNPTRNDTDKDADGLPDQAWSRSQTATFLAGSTLSSRYDSPASFAVNAESIDLAVATTSSTNLTVAPLVPGSAQETIPYAVIGTNSIGSTSLYEVARRAAAIDELLAKFSLLNDYRWFDLR